MGSARKAGIRSGVRKAAFASAQVELTHDWDPETYSRDDISIELLQQGRALPPAEPWTSMSNVGR
jgi:hypothetical protein